MESSNEIDLDDLEGIGKIQSVICVDGFFYILSNKKQGRLGLFLMKIHEKDPYTTNNHHKSYLLSWKNRLEISDADLSMMIQ
jgi:hypothetical protein